MDGKSWKYLVDLVRFELTTSSMPCKKYQSLVDILTRNKRLSTGRFGRQWTPQGGFWASGLHADSRTPQVAGTWRAFLRARLQGCSICCLPKETTINFHIRTMPMWMVLANFPQAEGKQFKGAYNYTEQEPCRGYASWRTEASVVRDARTSIG